MKIDKQKITELLDVANQMDCKMALLVMLLAEKHLTEEDGGSLIGVGNLSAKFHELRLEVGKMIGEEQGQPDEVLTFIVELKALLKRYDSTITFENGEFNITVNGEKLPLCPDEISEHQITETLYHWSQEG